MSLLSAGGATGQAWQETVLVVDYAVSYWKRHDIATGATGRNHGLLHSGARYAVTDPESARECIEENMILKRVARHCVEKRMAFLLLSLKIR